MTRSSNATRRPSSTFRWKNNAALAFIKCFIVLSIDDEYGEEDDDDYETKDMGVHDMDWKNSANFLTDSEHMGASRHRGPKHGCDHLRQRGGYTHTPRMHKTGGARPRNREDPTKSPIAENQLNPQSR